MIASVLVDVKAKEVDRTFDYLVPAILEHVIEVGQRVKVQFGPRLIMGYVLELKDKSEYDKLKSIKEITFVIRMHGGHHFFAEGEKRKLN